MIDVLRLAVVCIGIGLVIALPTPTTEEMTIEKAEKYFMDYGYMGPNMPDKELSDLMDTNKEMAMEYAVKIFQRRYSAWGLNETGVLDDATMNLMKKPRCGMIDIMTKADTGMDMRRRRYVLTGSRWGKTDLSYKITRYPADYDLDVNEVDYEIERAFKVWSDVTPLTFRKIEYRSREFPDIEIQFNPSYYSHGDPLPFDGPGGVLAHAFFPDSPILPGDAHFDDGELWTIDSATGVNFFLVAAHEFGHALGLAHSRDPSALMAPFYAGYKPDFTLPYDDIMGIQALYGPPNPRGPTTTTQKPGATPVPPTMMPGGSDVCQEATFDAVTTVMENNQKKLFGFRGDYFFQINEDGTVAQGFPKLISQSWPGLPSNVDAALFLDERWIWYAPENKWIIGYPVTYFFKGNQYWRVQDNSPVRGPRFVSDLAWNFPESIDAAIAWKGTGTVMLFKDDQFYEYSEWYGIERGYPRPISSVWNGLPDSVDAAIQTPSGEHVFFKGTQHYSYGLDYQVQAGYPKHNSEAWFNCPSGESDGNFQREQEEDEEIIDLRNVRD